MNKEQIVCVSGGFDPLHHGHTSLLSGAACFGRLVVILNSDEWLWMKKGYALLSWQERKMIISCIKGVEEVVEVNDADGSVCEALEKIKPSVFANGGLRNINNTPERQLCEKMGIHMAWGVGGLAANNISEELVRKILKIANNYKFDSVKEKINFFYDKGRDVVRIKFASLDLISADEIEKIGFSKSIFLNFNDKHQLLGFEIIDATKILNKEILK